MAVSDGSYIDRTKVGVASWIIKRKDRSEYVRGLCIVPGPKKVQSAYRSKLVGLLAIMDKIFQWSSSHGIEDGGCKLACDGVSALNMAATSQQDSVNANSKHVDIISSMSRIQARTKIRYHPVHVKGHADDAKTHGNLSHLEKMNVSMDFYAKQLAKSLI